MTINVLSLLAGRGAVEMSSVCKENHSVMSIHERRYRRRIFSGKVYPGYMSKRHITVIIRYDGGLSV